MKKNITANPNYKVSTETKTIVKNITLEGVTTLKAEKISTTFEVTHELHSKTNLPFRIVSKDLINEIIEPLSFNLIEVTPEDLSAYRKSGISSFVLKMDEKFYYTSLPDNISFVSSTILGLHQCSECNHLSAADDEHGGCEKVRNYSKCIEKYPWITIGYETFNTTHDSFVVINCLHYEKFPPRKKFTSLEVNAMKLGIAQFVWDDVNTLEEVRARKKRYKSI